jgi:butyryl-CoA dehydrogenase
VSEFVDARVLRFQLFDLLDVCALTERERFAGQERATYEAVLDTALRLAAGRFAPHNRAADRDEPRLENGRVIVHPEVKPALAAFAEAGFLAAHHDAALGGAQLPWTVVQAAFACFQAANIATAAYPFLTVAAGNVIRRFGDSAQQARCLPPLLDGRWLATMCLSEPGAGSSLADIRTTARVTPDGTWRLAGTKHWISAGAHELSDNILHLVLARTEGAPPGVKGLSLFLVPRDRVAPDGRPGAPNGVALVSLLHKMGYRGTTSTILAFGEREDCIAELIGGRHQGLACMFQMMNEARIGVGLGAAMLGHAGYRHALDYARERRQGRLPQAKDPRQPPVPIIAHADIRRMLLAQKAWSEGGIALCLFAARLVDDAATAPEAAARREAALLLEVLTPVCKAWPAVYGPRANDLAIQVLGGYGYTRDYPVEQYYRDNRLNPIHEGTNGIQAIDLLGRKVALEGGAALGLLAVRLSRCAERARAVPPLAPLGAALEAAWRRLRAVTETLLRREPAEALADATLYLEAFGHVLVAWLWLEQALCAERAGPGGAADGDFLRGVVQACRFFFAYELPQVGAWCEVLEQSERLTLETEPDWL